jgi:hypothetical protein
MSTAPQKFRTPLGKWKLGTKTAPLDIDKVHRNVLYFTYHSITAASQARTAANVAKN